MKSVFLITLSVALGLIATTVTGSELGWGFKSPAFHYGNGYSQHVLSVEQLQHNRKQDRQDKADAEQARIERELENTTLNKFIKNVESRIYATLSKQMVDSMFTACDASTTTCANTGTATIEGSTITWTKDTTTGSITLNIIEEDGSSTTITIPGSGEFNF
tara:strand:- start:2035 stop:2517 length:483 start_codon:yes stop_codon:yes gene_type:complete